MNRRWLLGTRVQARTGELSQSVDELRALGEVSQAVNSTVDLKAVLNTIVAKATQLSSTEAGAIYVFDQTVQEFHLPATYGMDDAIRLASYVPGELIPLPLSGSIPELPHVAKVENRTTLKISRKLIFGLLCCCVAFQRHCGGP